VCVLQAISYRNMFSHHQKTIMFDAPMDSPAGTAAAETAAETARVMVAEGVPAVPGDPATLDNLGTPEGSPRHADKQKHRHRLGCGCALSFVVPLGASLGVMC
jgi:hypothetical protein